MGSLSISLHNEPKRYLRSKKKYLAVFFCILLLAFFIFHYLTHRDTTSHIFPANAQTTINIILSPANKQLLHDNIGNDTILPNTGITWDDAMFMADNQISAHINDSGSVFALTLDNKLEQSQINTILQFGAYVSDSANISVISNTAVDLIDNEHFNIQIASYLPWFDGSISNQGVKNGYIQINNNGIELIGQGNEETGDFGQIYIPPDAKPIIYASSTNTDDDLLTRQLFSYNSISPLSSTGLINNQYPWKYAIYENNEGELSFTILLEQTMPLDNLAQLVKTLVQTGDLSTIALTIDDDTRVLEMRYNEDNVDVSITSDENHAFIHAKNAKNEVHGSQIGNYSIISNFDISQILDENEILSTEKTDIHTFADIDYIKHNFNAVPKSTFIDFFSSLSISNKNIYLNW